MRVRCLVIGCLVGLPAGWSCGDEDPGGADVCPLSPTGRLLLEDVVRSHVFDAAAVAAHSNVEAEIAFSLRLPGTAYGISGQAELEEDCPGPVASDYRCDRADLEIPPRTPFEEDHDTCLGFGCEEALISLTEVYFTMLPHSEPNDRHEFTYDMEERSGWTARMDQNPVRRWRADVRDRTDAVVTATLDDQLEVTVTDTDEVVDLRQAGTVELRKDGDDLTGIEIRIALPVLGDGDAASSGVELTLTAEGLFGGSVQAEGEVVATLSGDAAASGLEALLFAWQGECAESP